MPAWYDQHDVRMPAEIGIGGVTPELTARVAIYMRDPALSAYKCGPYVGTLELDENDLRRALEEIEARSERARRTVGTIVRSDAVTNPRAAGAGLHPEER